MTPAHDINHYRIKFIIQAVAPPSVQAPSASILAAINTHRLYYLKGLIDV